MAELLKVDYPAAGPSTAGAVGGWRGGTAVRYSQAREGNEQAMLKKAVARFEKQRSSLRNCTRDCRARTHKKIDAIWKRIGRLQAKSNGAGQHYQIEVAADESGAKATPPRSSGNNAQWRFPSCPIRGVYCLCSNQTDWEPESM